MAKKKQKKSSSPRNAMAYAASILCRRVSMKDRRMKRLGSKKNQDKKAIEDGWN